MVPCGFAPPYGTTEGRRCGDLTQPPPSWVIGIHAARGFTLGLTRLSCERRRIRNGQAPSHAKMGTPPAWHPNVALIFIQAAFAQNAMKKAYVFRGQHDRFRYAFNWFRASTGSDVVTRLCLFSGAVGTAIFTLQEISGIHWESGVSRASCPASGMGFKDLTCSHCCRSSQVPIRKMAPR